MKKLANILNSGQCALFSFVLVATLLLSCAKTEIAQNDAIANSSENTVPGEGDETGDPSNPEAPGADDPSQPGGPTVPTGPGADDYISPDHFRFIHLECNAKADAENPSTKLFGIEDAAMRVEPLDEDDTKTYLGEVINKKQLIYWTGGDKIKVYYAPGTSNWKKGTVKHGGDAESTIDIEVNEEDDYYYAFYPTCDTTVVTYAGGTYSGNTYEYGAFTVTVPTVQDGLFENCHMAVGKASKVAKSFAFSNVGSYLKITVDNTTATGITLQATNASDNIVGQFVVPFTDDEGTIGTPVLVPETGSSSVTVNLPTGRTAPVTVFVALLPNVSFSQGFRLRYEYGDGKVHPGYAYVKRDGRAVNRRSILNIKTLDDRIREEYFVKTTGSCSDVDVAGAGNSWDNALNVTGLADLLNQPVDGGGVQINADAYDRAWMLDGATIHVAAGEYSLPATTAKNALKIEFSRYSKQVKINFLGAYPTGLSGIATPARDTSLYVSAFKPDTDGDGTVILGNQTDVSFDGFTFKDMDADASSRSALQAAAGDTGDATLHLNACIFDNNKHGDSYTGAACDLAKCTAVITNCTFTGNYARNGSAMNVGSASANVSVSNCKFDSNSTYNTSGAVQNGGGTLDVDHCLFVNNQCCVSDTTTATYGAGGAFHANGTGSVTTFTDCVFSSNEGKLGGALSLQTATVTCTRCVFEDNVAWKNKGQTGTYSGTREKPCGGAAYLSSSDARLTLNDCVLRRNSAPYASGGAIAFGNSSAQLTLGAGTTFSDNFCWREGGAINCIGQITISGTSGSPVEFNHNYTTNADRAKGNGGAISLGSGSRASISHVAFTGNVAGSGTSNNYSNGGGIYTENVTSFTADNCTFTGHLARNGGGVQISGSGGACATCYFTNCAFTDNWCDDNNEYFDATIGSCNFHGGAVCVTGVPVEFSECTFSGNTANNGSGAMHINNANSAVTCSECTFTENSTGSTAWGGAVQVEAGSFTASNSSFSQNSAKVGGAIYSSQALTLDDCILDNNSATNSAAALYVAGNLTITGTDTLKCAIRNHGTTSSRTPDAPIIFGASSAISLDHCKINDNHFTSAEGTTGFFPLGDQTLSATDCVFVDNTSSTRCNGLFAALTTPAAGSIMLVRTSIRNCVGGGGAAIYVAGGIQTVTGTAVSITDGDFKGNDSNTYGAAINCTHTTKDKSTVTISLNGTLLRGNTATLGGGAIHANSDSNASGRVISLTNCTFDRNRQTKADSGDGAGAINLNRGILTISGGTYQGNSAAYGNGGVLRVRNDASFSISNATITGNSAPNAGAIHADLARGFTNECTISGTTFSGNTATDAASLGGAIYWNCASWSNSNNNQRLRIYGNSVLTDNQAGKAGAAIYLNVGRVYLVNSSVTNNKFANYDTSTDGYGGAIYMNSPYSKIDVEDCDISGNLSDGKGGAFHLNGGRLFLKRSTVKNNRAYSRGGAIYQTAANGFFLVSQCSLVGNYLTKSSDWHGSCYHCNGGGTNTYGMFLNSTIADGDTGRSTGTINGQPNLLMCNCTLVGNNSVAALRVEGSKNGTLLNNIILNIGSGDAILHAGSYTWSDIGGYNILGTVNPNGKTVTNIPTNGSRNDKTGKVAANFGSWAWNAASGYYSWDGTLSGAAATSTPIVVSTDYISVGLKTGFNYNWGTKDSPITDGQDFSVYATNLGGTIINTWNASNYYYDQRATDGLGDRRVAGCNTPGAIGLDTPAVNIGGGGQYSGSDINQNDYVY